MDEIREKIVEILYRQIERLDKAHRRRIQIRNARARVMPTEAIDRAGSPVADVIS